ncbi:MAG: HAMP domain-containing sensor histidine kinase [Campylobacterota bacterium]|nr:HAMP domain-containing sensor histidine kinase [Campylobacterota bacterium]
MNREELEAELADLKTKNELLERLLANEQEKNLEKEQLLSHKSRSAAMGEMVENIAHQWRQPLNILALVLQDIYISGQLGTLDTDKLEENYSKANNMLQYMSQTIDDFRNFLKKSDNLERFALNNIFKSIDSILLLSLKKNNIAITMDNSNGYYLQGNQNEFLQVFINIINNAQDAIILNNIKNGKIILHVKKINNTIQISIQDNAGGIKAENIDRIFDPYFTTKHKSQGTGIGLYMSKQIIEKDNVSRLYVRNSEEGANFIIEVPAK